MREARVTLADVAAAAGVSVATASHVYNRPGRVAGATRDRVQAAATRLGYQGPNAAARSLRRQRANAIGLVIGEELTYTLADATASGLVAGVAEALVPAGSSLLLVPGRGGADLGPLQGTGRVLDAVVDGMLLYSLTTDEPAVDAVLQRRLPVVTIDQPRLPGVPHVGIDDRGGARLVGEHLRALGHRRVGILSLDLRRDGHGGAVTPERRRAATSAMALARLRGYDDALDRRGLHRTVVEVPRNLAAAACDAALALLEGPDRPTALVCMSDTIAQGALRAAARLGLDVPADLSVAGFDGRPVAADERPVTTVRQDSTAKGRRATELLLAAIAGERPRGARLPVSLLDRGTTAPPAR